MAVIHSRHRAIESFLSVLEGLPAHVLDVRNNLLQTPLHLAVLTNQPNVVEKLVLSGASTNIPDRKGNTPAHIACKKGEVKCLQTLLRRPEPQGGQSKYADLVLTNHDGQWIKIINIHYNLFIYLFLLRFGSSSLGCQVKEH